MLYYHKAISILRQSNDSIQLASAILNAGEDLLNNNIYDSAFLFFNESRLIFERIKYPIGIAYSLGNIGIVYANTGENNLAEKNIKDAISKGKELLKAGKSKADVTREIFPMIQKEDREAICHVFQQGAGLTQKGSMTYYYNCRRSTQKSS